MIDDLAAMRHPIIRVEGHLATSKIAWKFAVLRVALIYRLVDLSEATVREWCGENCLSSMILARAFFETAALAHWLSERASALVDARDIDGLDNLVMKTSFGVRNRDYLAEGDVEATNVLTMIDSLDKALEGARRHYERLSDVAHPNSYGQHQFYTRLDQERIEVHFSRTKRARKDSLPALSASLHTGAWAARQLEGLEKTIEDIASLHVAQQ